MKSTEATIFDRKSGGGEGPAVALCPSDLTAPNKSHRLPLCHPERTQISFFTALPAATYAALLKEDRMKSTEATIFDRKSGEGEGPAVRLDVKQRPYQ